VTAGDDWLDETVFGPAAHAEIPHVHTHRTGPEQPEGSPHDHAHFHPGGWNDGAGVHEHLHAHPAPAEEGKT
jgi:hypothetical protein